LGVGAVISGSFSGWNFGLEVGGFGGLAIAKQPEFFKNSGCCHP